MHTTTPSRLCVQRAHWTNRYNNRSDGYITYPRNYQPERKYPAVVVTHTNVCNRFADQEFQWDFPVEVLAESGYFVLSVNEPYASLRARATVQERSRKERVRNASDAQFRLKLHAVATMEAALSSLIASRAA